MEANLKTKIKFTKVKIEFLLYTILMYKPNNV